MAPGHALAGIRMPDGNNSRCCQLGSSPDGGTCEWRPAHAAGWGPRQGACGPGPQPWWRLPWPAHHALHNANSLRRQGGQEPAAQVLRSQKVAGRGLSSQPGEELCTVLSTRAAGWLWQQCAAL